MAKIEESSTGFNEQWHVNYFGSTVD
jgi:hypothetical protein